MFGLGGVMLGALLAWLIGRGISRPIQGMTQAMTALAGGDLKVVVPAQDNKDEIGEMAKAVLVFRDRLARAELARRPHGHDRTSPKDVINDQA